jgi:putative transcription factor
MVNCDMCGKERELVDVIVEGAVVEVCLDCSKHGSVVTINQPVVDKRIEFQKEKESGTSYVTVIVSDFGQRIKAARERKGLKQEDLAQDLAEKESVIHQLETGKLKPSFRLAKKLSVFLNIDLVESVESNIKGATKDVDLKSASVTIGDLLKKDI